MRTTKMKWFSVLTIISTMTNLSVSINSAEVFAMEPGPGPVVIPVGSQIGLTCSVFRGFETAGWMVSIPGKGKFSSQNTVHQPVLEEHGISERRSNNGSTSVLIIKAMQVDALEYVHCEAINLSSFQMIISTQVDVTIYGRPSSPSNVTISENGINSVQVRWSSPIIPGVTLYFNLIITNLNSSNNEATNLSTHQQHYVFTANREPISACNVYTFQVTARNHAGIGDPSEIISKSLPSLPQISIVEDSVQHSLVKIADGVTLSVHFNEISTCPDYPVMNYLLVLVNSEGEKVAEESLSPPRQASRMLSIAVMDELMEDSLYSYFVVATNVIGNTTSSPVAIVTTDVKGVNSTYSTQCSTYSIQCSYITGSDARGCVYTLVSKVEGVDNITGEIERTNSEGVVIGLHNASFYSEILAHDWERDDTIGTLPIRGHIATVDKCIPPKGSLSLLVLTISIVLPLFLLLVIVAVITAALIVTKKGRSSKVDVEKKRKQQEMEDAVYNTLDTNRTSLNTTELNEPRYECLDQSPIYHILEHSKDSRPTNRPEDTAMNTSCPPDRNTAWNNNNIGTKDYAEISPPHQPAATQIVYAEITPL